MEELNFEDYHFFVVGTKRYSENYRLTYPALGLTSEAGEVAGKLKKIMRDHDGHIDEALRNDLNAELGDVLWYVVCCADDLGISFRELVANNMNKLQRRVENNTIHGDGDNR